MTIQPPFWPLVLLRTTLATTPSPSVMRIMVPMTSARKVDTFESGVEVAPRAIERGRGEAINAARKNPVPNRAPRRAFLFGNQLGNHWPADVAPDRFEILANQRAHRLAAKIVLPLVVIGEALPQRLDLFLRRN